MHKMFKIKDKNAGIAVATARLLDAEIEHFCSFVCGQFVTQIVLPTAQERI